MKKLALLCVFLLALAMAAFAQRSAPPAKHVLKARVLMTQTGASVALAWTQSSSSGITSNNVYRSTVSGGPYAEIYSSPNLITAYTDSTVSYTTTYYYVVTVVCATCSPAESGYSNQAEAAVTAQGQPAAPSGLTATPTP
jgi:fibronectin type 3 domain-containing protein